MNGIPNIWEFGKGKKNTGEMSQMPEGAVEMSEMKISDMKMPNMDMQDMKPEDISAKMSELKEMEKLAAQSMPAELHLIRVYAHGDSKDSLQEEIIASGKKIKGIVVRAGDIVDGICVKYEDGRQGTFIGSSTGGEENTIIFDDDDELVKMTGHVGVSFGGGRAIGGLTFVTKNNKTYGPFGRRGNEGKVFTVTAPKGAKVKGLCGSVNKGGNGDFLVALGLLI